MTTGPDRGANERAWRVHALRYATLNTLASEQFLNYEMYREPDRAVVLDYFFWVITDGTDSIIVDTGFTEAVGRRRGRTWLGHDATTLLGFIGIDPATISTVILTHLHYDHCGNVSAFPNASFVVDPREVEHWLNGMGDRGVFSPLTEAQDIDNLRILRSTGRFIDPADYAPPVGIGIEHVGGHTPGQLIVYVQTATGSVVIAADAVHLNEEINRDRPYRIVSDVPAMYRAYDRLRELRADGARILPGHDPDVMRQFPALFTPDNEQVGVTVR